MKKFICVTLVGVMVLALSGCGAKEEKQVYDISVNVSEGTETEDSAEAKQVDAGALAQSLLNEISYTDTLTDVDLETAKMFLNLSEVEVNEAFIYESSGATAEEIVVLSCKDADSAAKAKEAFSQRVEEQTENFTDYVPEELPKLKDAVIITNGEYAVLSVSADASKAKDIIDSALK